VVRAVGGSECRTSGGPDPVVKVVAGFGVDEVIRAFGSNIRVEWLDISGAKATSGCTGTSVGIAAASTDGSFFARYNYIHHNDSVGITTLV
jgi:hypothetical protein